MKRILNALVLVALMGTMAGSARAAAGPSLELPVPASEMTAARWQSFSKNLVVALQSDNKGLQVEAMRLAIQYAENVDVKAARIDLMRLYRNSKDEAVRRMAVVAMGKSGDGPSIGYLKLFVDGEQSPCVRQTIAAVIAEHDAR